MRCRLLNIVGDHFSFTLEADKEQGLQPVQIVQTSAELLQQAEIYHGGN